jgi:hypothetical protein
MRIFRRKTITSNEQPLSGPGWSAYSEVPEDFDFETWANEHENFYVDPPISKKLKHFISYLLFFIKYRVLHLSSANDVEIFDEDEDENEEEFSKTFERGIEIISEINPLIQEFAERLVDNDRAEIMYRNKRIVFYRKDHPTNTGYAHYIENLDGSDKFEHGWGHESGTRIQMIDSISHDVGFVCALIELGRL